MSALFPPKTASWLSLLVPLLCLIASCPISADSSTAAEGPTLARLSFWLPAERIHEFEAAYEGQLVSILQEHGLALSAHRGRPTVEGVFSRLFAVSTPAHVDEVRAGLKGDSRWREAVQSLALEFASGFTDSVSWYSLCVYDTPAGPGRNVRAGSGYRQGLWQSFSAQDGLPSVAFFRPFIQDRRGNLWLPTTRGVVRFDGVEFVTFTAADGLASNDVRAIFEDWGGNLWFATDLGGVSRFDGHRFVSFGREDGLPSLHADKRSVRQITYNLLSNAFKFTNRKGSILISVTVADGEMLISMKDTGIGIAADKLKIITEPFSQADSNPHKPHEGTGLGLSIVKSLVESHGGRLEICSDIGKGTTVSVTFPCQETKIV